MFKASQESLGLLFVTHPCSVCKKCLSRPTAPHKGRPRTKARFQARWCKSLQPSKSITIKEGYLPCQENYLNQKLVRKPVATIAGTSIDTAFLIAQRQEDVKYRDPSPRPSSCSKPVSQQYFLGICNRQAIQHCRKSQNLGGPPDINLQLKNLH